MPQRRITVEEVLEAYRVTGMKPTKEIYCCTRNNELCGCAIGALAVADGVPPSDAEAIERWIVENIDCYYMAGFVSGFDGNGIFPESHADMKQGYADGTAVREAVFGKQGA